MREHTVEGYLVRRVRELGGLAVKHTSPGRAGDPDRLIKLPSFPAALLELKRPKKQPTELQFERLTEWNSLGVVAGWASNHQEVDLFLARVQAQ